MPRCLSRVRAEAIGEGEGAMGGVGQLRGTDVPRAVCAVIGIGAMGLTELDLADLDRVASGSADDALAILRRGAAVGFHPPTEYPRGDEGLVSDGEPLRCLHVLVAAGSGMTRNARATALRGLVLARLEIRIRLADFLARFDEFPLTGLVQRGRANRHADIRHMPERRASRC